MYSVWLFLVYRHQVTQIQGSFQASTLQFQQATCHSQGPTFYLFHFTTKKDVHRPVHIAMNCERDYMQEGRQRGGHHGTGNKEGVWLVRLSEGIGLERLN